MPNEAEELRRNEVLTLILAYIRDNRTIKLPEFSGGGTGTSADYALLALEPNEFSGTVGDYRYQFEGEDDLLHLAVMRNDRQALSVEEARTVVSFLLPTVPAALIWLRPGTLSQHFYVGHDELLPRP
jgi:hypothetical protein